MKYIVLIILIAFIVKKGDCQQAAYSLPLPEKWGVEKIPFPISFAPQIPYKGTEEIRFTPGWGDNKSGEYWSYTFLWFIDGIPHLNKGTLQHYLTTYFTGLYLINQKSKNAAPAGNFTSVQFKKMSTAANDQETYEGQITTLNFLTSLQIKFNVRVHLRNFITRNQSAIFFEISPETYQDLVWAKLDTIVNGFQLKE